MSNASNIVNGLKMNENTMTTLYSLSFYSPIIVTIGVFMFSIFSGRIGNGLFYIFCLFIVTAIRSLIIFISSDPSTAAMDIPNICNMGSFLPYTNLTYSTFILTFSLFYFLTPMIIINIKNKIDVINYSLLMFFVSYIFFDIFVKKSLNCISSFLSMNLFSDLFGGLALGALISGLLFISPLKKNLFINDINSDKEVCSMPSKQQFKCSVYKNGELVSSSVN
jgi:hypothetical protein